MAIRKVYNAFVISSGGMWLPGCYTTERAARYALRFPNETLQKLQDRANDRNADFDKRVITFEDLQAERKKMKGGV